MKFSIWHLLLVTLIIAVVIACSIEPRNRWEKMNVKDSLDRLTTAIRKHYPERKLSPVVPMAPAELARLEKQLPMAPRQLFELFELYDFRRPNIFSSFTPISPSDMQDSIDGQIGFYEEYIGPLADNPWTSCNGDYCKLNMAWRKKWIPLGLDFGGDMFFIDMDPAEGGIAGQIVSTNEDGWYLTVHAYSLAHWMGRIAENIENGRTRSGGYSCKVYGELPNPK